MEPTVLIYSSHDRCNLIHNDWIVQRALGGNRRILFLPLSASTDDGDSQRHQVYNWERFEWFFNWYRQYGLSAFPFIWHRELRQGDVDQLWDALATAEVVILGGGRPALGMHRFRELGERFGSGPDHVPDLLRGRCAGDLLTVGYSAGVDQLCELMSSASGHGAATPGFGLARRVVATSHFALGQQSWLDELARAFPDCLVFGLPNDSGLALAEGQTASGRRWQALEVIVDTSWDRPEDSDHVKTRQGVLVQHLDAEGRHWGFRGGDTVVRVFGDSEAPDETYFVIPGKPVLDAATRGKTPYGTVDDIVAAR